MKLGHDLLTPDIFSLFLEKRISQVPILQELGHIFNSTRSLSLTCTYKYIGTSFHFLSLLLHSKACSLSKPTPVFLIMYPGLIFFSLYHFFRHQNCRLVKCLKHVLYLISLCVFYKGATNNRTYINNVLFSDFLM